jgi:hypothetical protein
MQCTAHTLRSGIRDLLGCCCPDSAARGTLFKPRDESDWAEPTSWLDEQYLCCVLSTEYSRQASSWQQRALLEPRCRCIILVIDGCMCLGLRTCIKLG